MSVYENESRWQMFLRHRTERFYAWQEGTLGAIIIVNKKHREERRAWRDHKKRSNKRFLNAELARVAEDHREILECRQRGEPEPNWNRPTGRSWADR